MKTILNLKVFLLIFICNVESFVTFDVKCNITLEPSDSVENLTPLESELTPIGRASFADIAAKYGFPNCEDRNVITDDGYVLTVHHIPGDLARPVLLAHGNTVDAACWINRGNISLAIVLAKRGYDVWAINFRGTTLSRRHLHLDVKTQQEQFYNYTFHEQGVYDLPATIDLILEATNQTQLLAIGYSVGTTNFYVLGSERPEYNDKIKLFISLAPISFLQRIRGLAKIGVAAGTIIPTLKKIFCISELVGSEQLGSKALDDLCLGPAGYEKCVYGILFPTFGFDSHGFERGFQRIFFRNFPQGTSIKLFEHLIQIIHRNKFVKYDYGKEGNLVEYGSEVAPEYDLSKACMKMALFVGKEDFLASVPDAERLREALPNVVEYQVMPYEKFNHLDFAYGRYMPSNLYPFLLPTVDKYIV